MRFPLIPIKLFNFPAIFGMSKSLFRNVPLGLSMAVYAETGFLVDKIKKIKSTDLLSGYGIGFIAHMPYANVMRFDIAVNDKFDNIDFIFLCVITIMLFITMFIGKKHKLTKIEAVFFVILYFAYLVFLFVRK